MNYVEFAHQLIERLCPWAYFAALNDLRAIAQRDYEDTASELLVQPCDRFAHKARRQAIVRKVAGIVDDLRRTKPCSTHKPVGAELGA